MRLRTRLTLAFLLLSVVPLTAITLYSYSSSIQAFRRAVEAEETAIAADMGRRMDMEAANVSDRFGRVSAAAQGRTWNPGDRAGVERFQKEVVATLGDAGNYFAKLQFIPRPPPPPPPPAIDAPGSRPGHYGPPPRGRRFDRPYPGPRDPARRKGPASPEMTASAGTRAPVPPAVPSAPASASSPQPTPPESPAQAGASWPPGTAAAAQPGGGDVPATAADGLKVAADATSFAIDLIPAGSIPPEAKAALGNLKDLSSTLPRIARSGMTLGAGLQAAAKAMEEGARDLERRLEVDRRNADARRADIERWIAHMNEGKPLDVPVQQDGRVIGTVNAEVSLDRMLRAVLGGRTREAGDIAFAIDTQNHLWVHSPEERKKLESIGLLAQARKSKQQVQTLADDNWVLVTRRHPSGMVFGIARPIGTALGDIRRATGRNLGLGMLAILVALVGIVPISSRMTRNLSVLHAGVRQIAQGDLSVRVPVRSKDEIGALGAAFNQMAQDLGAHQKLIAERERLRGELELCRQIQTEMLPKHPLRLGFAEINGVSIPAREVGGDFFNYFLLPQGEVVLLVGDVSGKGVGAALLMANVQATLRARLSLERDLAGLADAIDREIDQSTPSAVYLTLFMAILDQSHHLLRYVNAGHNPQFILHAEGGLDRLPSTGLPIAMFAGHGYTEGSVPLNDGDILFFYTDGITELENEQGEMFGSERLEALLLAHHKEGVDALLAAIEQEVLKFRGAADLFDDATMMVLRLGATKTEVQQRVGQ